MFSSIKQSLPDFQLVKRRTFGLTIVRSMVIALLKFYKRGISPSMPHSCRFVPTCSQYSIEAIEKYGLIKGGLKSLLRIMRCNPFSRGGYDPVR